MKETRFSAWLREERRDGDAVAVPKPRLTASTLYLGDNGRAFCGTLRCAGATAFYGGRDLSGQRVLPLTAMQAVKNAIACETCGRQPNLVTVA